MTTCVGVLTGLAMASIQLVPLALVPALAALLALRRGGAWRLLPALAYGLAGAYAGLEMTVIDRPWMPTVYVVTALLWVPPSARPFSDTGRAWLSFVASFAALTTVMNRLFSSDSFYCGLV